MSEKRNTFCKHEKLCTASEINFIFKNGKWGKTSHLRYCFLKRENTGTDRILVSVPKKKFKRAVKRNLLKRRMRESFRINKPGFGDTDIILIYNSQEILSFREIEKQVKAIFQELEIS